MACNDADGSANPCRSGAYQPYDCLDTSCAFVVITTANFGSDPGCRTTAGGYLYTSLGYPADGTTRTPFYYGWKGDSVTVTCGSGLRTATASMVW